MATSVSIIEKEDTLSKQLQILKQRFPELPFLIIQKASGGIKSYGRSIRVFTQGFSGNKNRIESGNVLAGITGKTFDASYSYTILGRKSGTVGRISARLANILESRNPGKFPIIGTLARVLPQEGLIERVAYSVMNQLVKASES
jgi:hypothetical protein